MRVTYHEVEEKLRRRPGGATAQQIANDVGVDYDTAYRILHRLWLSNRISSGVVGGRRVWHHLDPIRG